MIDPKECTSGAPCPPPGGGTGEGTGATGGTGGSGGTAGTGGSGGTAGTSGSGGTAGTSGSGGTAGTGGTAGGGGITVSGQVQTFDTQLFEAAILFAGTADLLGQGTSGEYDQAAEFSASTFSLSGLSNPSHVLVDPDDAALWNGLYVVAAAGTVNFPLARQSQLEEIVLEAGFGALTPEVASDTAQILLTFTDGDDAGVSGVAIVNLTVAPDAVIYDTQGSWATDPQDIQSPGTGNRGQAWLLNVPAAGFPGETVQVFYRLPGEDQKAIDIEVMRGRMTFVNISTEVR